VIDAGLGNDKAAATAPDKVISDTKAAHRLLEPSERDPTESRSPESFGADYSKAPTDNPRRDPFALHRAAAASKPAPL
jgi:hypothetical protein